jgi:hypothetical protein
MDNEQEVILKERLLKIGLPENNRYAALIPDALLRGNFSGKPLERTNAMKMMGVIIEAQELGATGFAQGVAAMLASESGSSSAVDMKILKEMNTHREVLSRLAAKREQIEQESE